MSDFVIRKFLVQKAVPMSYEWLNTRHTHSAFSKSEPWHSREFGSFSLEKISIEALGSGLWALGSGLWGLVLS